MATLQDLIARIGDADLQERIAAETKKLLARKKFGLVFEEHLPERAILCDMPVGRGATVALKRGDSNRVYRVTSVRGDVAWCVRADAVDDAETENIPVKNLVVTAEFGEPVYPYLKPVGTVRNASDSGPWHTLIEAENFHALQLLEYLYAGKVDCIYIDPPYNTGARDWKYNNDYVDVNDQYRHSKWLSFMQRRLEIAKRLLNPENSVLIVTIDEKEYLHLGCLLEEMFANAHMHMVSIVINPNGVARNHEMYRVEEYAFFVYLGNAGPSKLADTMFTSDAQLQRGEAPQRRE